MAGRVVVQRGRAGVFTGVGLGRSASQGDQIEVILVGGFFSGRI